jgi:hypothetical protein
MSLVQQPAPSHLRQHLQLCTVDAMTLQLSKAEKKGVAFLEHEGTVSLFSCEATRLTSQDVCFLTSQVRAYRATCQAQTTQRMDQFFQWWVVSLAPRCNRHSRDMQRSMSLASLSRSFKYLQTLVSIPCAVLFYRIPQHRQRISKKKSFQYQVPVRIHVVFLLIPQICAHCSQGATWETTPTPFMMFPSRCSYLTHCLWTGTTLCNKCKVIAAEFWWLLLAISSLVIQCHRDPKDTISGARGVQKMHGRDTR